MRYFVEVDGTRYGTVNRYHILEGKTVVAITASRPEGQEVSRPNGVKWNIRPFIASPVGVEVKRVEFHNVSGEIADAARKRAGDAHKKRIRWNGGKR